MNPKQINTVSPTLFGHYAQDDNSLLKRMSEEFFSNLLNTLFHRINRFSDFYDPYIAQNIAQRCILRDRPCNAANRCIAIA